MDLADIAGRGVFTQWLREGVFESVKISSSGALEWPGELDLCPDTIYMRLTGKTPEQVFPLLKKSLFMPELSRFYGIVVQVYYGDHLPAHFHVEYAGAIAQIDPLP